MKIAYVCLILQAIAIAFLASANISNSRQISEVRRSTYALADVINEKLGTDDVIPILLPGQTAVWHGKFLMQREGQ